MMATNPVHPGGPPLRPCFQLQLTGQLGELRQAQEWLAAIETEWDIPESTGFALAVCVEEALANIVMYSHASGRDGCVALQMDRAVDGFVLTIEDDGSPFDPTSVSRPPDYRTLAEAQVGQVGLHLIRNFAATMEYQRLNGRNLLTLTFASGKH
jgi:anti-sigma regulatory factor (Ser/Thr protein kinase)